jgi:hypothetical protein
VSSSSRTLMVNPAWAAWRRIRWAICRASTQVKVCLPSRLSGLRS